MSKLIDEFKEFISRGNVVDLAVGFIIGTAFGAIVKSLVDDVIMPPIGLALGKVDFSNLFAVLKEGDTPPPYHTVAAAKEAGAVTLNYGLFINSIITFSLLLWQCFVGKNHQPNAAEKEVPPALQPPKIVLSALPLYQLKPFAVQIAHLNYPKHDFYRT